MILPKKSLALLSTLFLAALPISAVNSMRTTKIVILLCSTGSIGSFAATYYLKRQIKKHPEKKDKLKKKKLLLQYIALTCAFGTLFSTNRIINHAIATLP